MRNNQRPNSQHRLLPLLRRLFRPHPLQWPLLLSLQQPCHQHLRLLFPPSRLPNSRPRHPLLPQLLWFLNRHRLRSPPHLLQNSLHQLHPLRWFHRNLQRRLPNSLQLPQWPTIRWVLQT